MEQQTQQTAVEWLEEMLIDNKYLLKDAGHLFEQTKQMEKEQKIKAQIEILREIGNHGSNAPLYGILKTTLIQLEQQLTKL